MSNLYVITGAPCSGKTTLLNSLSELGYEIIPEVARTYIDTSLSNSISVQELRKDELKFQQEVLMQKYKLEDSLNQNHIIFLDRGIPDSYAYFKLLGVEDESLLNQSLRSNYKKVFILEPCPYKEDYARIETPEEQLKLHSLIQEAYEKAGATIVHVPILPTKNNRVDFVLNNL